MVLIAMKLYEITKEVITDRKEEKNQGLSPRTFLCWTIKEKRRNQQRKPKNSDQEGMVHWKPSRESVSKSRD